MIKKKTIKEQTGAGGMGGATTTATFQPAVGPGGAPSKSGAFPGSALGYKKKKKTEQMVRRPFPTLEEELKPGDRVGFYDEVAKKEDYGVVVNIRNNGIIELDAENSKKRVGITRKDIKWTQVTEAYTQLRPVTKHQGTVVFNKGDIDSVANPKNFPVVTYKGINKRWGMAEKNNYPKEAIAPFKGINKKWGLTESTDYQIAEKDGKEYLLFFPTSYSKKSTPKEMREYRLSPSSPVGTKKEIIEFLSTTSAGSLFDGFALKTLEGNIEYYDVHQGKATKALEEEKKFKVFHRDSGKEVGTYSQADLDKIGFKSDYFIIKPINEQFPGAAKGGKGYHIAGAGTGGKGKAYTNEEVITSGDMIAEAANFYQNVKGSSVKEK